eukprot:m.120801 g.120801  ORF g.120801 m.120801 type:complete len:105 (+) comp12916_c0_seq104:38-352(+)
MLSHHHQKRRHPPEYSLSQSLGNDDDDVFVLEPVGVEEDHVAADYKRVKKGTPLIIDHGVCVFVCVRACASVCACVPLFFTCQFLSNSLFILIHSTLFFPKCVF